MRVVCKGGFGSRLLHFLSARERSTRSEEPGFRELSRTLGEQNKGTVAEKMLPNGFLRSTLMQWLFRDILKIPSGPALSFRRSLLEGTSWSVMCLSRETLVSGGVHFGVRLTRVTIQI